MLDKIPQQVYKSFSFKQGETPDFELLKSYFIDKGVFINNKGGFPVIKFVDEYINMITNYIDNGSVVAISETEISQNIEIFGSVAQISSEYKLVFKGMNNTQTRYGVNLFQLINDNGRWLINSMCWDDREDKSLLKHKAIKS